VSGSSTDRFRRADAIFDAALDVPDDEQTAYVARACADDTELRAEVLGLLRASHSAGGVLDGAAAQMAAQLIGAGASPDAAVPARVGAYRVVREIGRGGMGRVFLGERADSQFEQRVALKLLQHASPGLVRRFLEERRILARLEHPGIARLIDGGVAANGLPYFALEYVEGEHVDRYCAARDLPLHARLMLVSRVCDAVSYAHRHLVIHRDLKPSNILVTPAGEVKLLDFGIAKLLDVGEADDTRTELRAMTPEFAAPEQVRGAPVSTSTDVYALGVLLYLLVAGERPYEVRGKSAAEIERIVCESAPPPPSARAPAALRRRLRGDLDLIVMTALQKAPGRRYATPAALAEDLERFRTGRPVGARPDDVAYRVRRFVGRHRATVAAGCTVAVGLVAATAFSLRQMHEAERQRDEARAQRDHARWQERRATATSDFLQEILQGVSVTGSAPAMPQLIDRARARLEERHRGDPRLLARVMTELADSYTPLHERNPLLARAATLAVEARDPATAAYAGCRLGKLAAEEGDLARARPSVARGLAHLAHLAPGDPASLSARVQCLRAQSTLARLEGRPAEAVRHARGAVALGRAVGDTTGIRYLSALNEEARALADAGQLRASLARTRDILAILDRTNRSAWIGAVYERANIAARLEALGEPRAADTALAAAIATARGLDPAWQVPPYLSLLAAELDAVQGRHARAVPGFRRVAAETRGGDGMRFAVRALDGLVASLLAARRPDEAARAADELRRLAPPAFRWYVSLADARLLHARGRTGAARRTLLAALVSRGFPEHAPATPHLPRLALEAALLALADGDAVAADSLAAHAERLALGEGHDEARSVVLAYARITRARAQRRPRGPVAGGAFGGQVPVTRAALLRALGILDHSLGADHAWARDARRVVAAPAAGDSLRPSETR
jgi:serine/threonine-protein kinase